MASYDPLKEPAAAEWLALGETERLALVEAYHRQARIRPPNMKLHATFHVIVENQAAMGDETPVRRTIARLMAEGLDRHDAVHAVAATLTALMNRVVRGGKSVSNPNAAYFAALERLTEKSWRRDFG